MADVIKTGRLLMTPRWLPKEDVYLAVPAANELEVDGSPFWLKKEEKQRGRMVLVEETGRAACGCSAKRQVLTKPGMQTVIRAQEWLVKLCERHKQGELTWERR